MVPRMVRNAGKLAAFAFILAGCQNPLAPGHERILGVSNVVAPASIAAEQSFKATLTVEYGGCVSFDRFESSRSGSRLEVVAIGIDHSGRNVACPDVIYQRPFEVSLHSGSPGILTLVVRQPDGTTTERLLTVSAGS